MGAVMAKAMQGMAYTTAKSNPNAVKFADGKYANLTDQQKVDLVAYMTEKSAPGQWNLPADEIARGKTLSESSVPASTTSRPTMQQKQVSARRRARASARPLISPDRKPGPAVAPISSAIEDVSKLGV